MKLYLTITFCLTLLLNNLHAQSIIGKWECETITSYITKQNGTTSATPNKIREKGISITWEFLSNGKFIARQDKLVQEGIWKLTGNKLLIKPEFDS